MVNRAFCLLCRVGLKTDYITYLRVLLLCLPIGLLAGSTSAWFLHSLDYLGALRENNKNIIWLLPLAGLLIAIAYKRYGKRAINGHNLILQEYQTPQQQLPWAMAPLVWASTLLTHLFGGSAGREGTAVQMGAVIADAFSPLLGINKVDRKTLLILGISAGFAAVFGTPLAGAVFAIEVLALRKTPYRALVPSLLVAYVAHYTCLAWQVEHSTFPTYTSTSFDFTYIAYALLTGLCCGLAARVFVFTQQQFNNMFALLKSDYLKPLLGGIIIAVVVFAFGTTKYIGLGLPTISAAFSANLPSYDFLLKLLFTTLTLAAGFKGGEVTPLFFIGATLGNALSYFTPLPMELMAAMAFVAVFAGATNTPIASTIMAVELFGYQGFSCFFTACIAAYLFSGRKSIYSAQALPWFKEKLYANFTPKSLSSS